MRSVAVRGALKLNLLAGRSPELCPFGERFGREADKRPLFGRRGRGGQAGLLGKTGRQRPAGVPVGGWGERGAL